MARAQQATERAQATDPTIETRLFEARRLLAALESQHGESTDQVDTGGTQILELQREVARLNEELAQVKARISKADELRAGAIRGLDRFHQRFSTALEVYRSQRAWTAMVALRKGYATLTREGVPAFLKWAARTAFTGCFGDLSPYDLDFPSVWDYVPEGLRTAAAGAGKAATHVPGERKYDVVVFAVCEFEFRFQRPQQIAAEFARQGHRVFWISPSRVLKEDAGQSYEADGLRENIWEVRLRGPRPDLYRGTLTPRAAATYAASLEELLRAFHAAEVCAVVQFPFWRQAALALRQETGAKLVYDCMDDWGNWTNEPRISTFSLGEEDRLAQECDVLLASSATLRERREACGRKPLLVRNAADFGFFASPAVEDRAPNKSRPIAGYYGAIADWFDIELLTRVATARPQYDFVVIGRVSGVDVSKLKALPNVSLLGEKHYRDIPRHLATFDVALIPFKENELTRAVDPVKVYEYFSQGKPVVSTGLAELQRASHLLYMASGAEEFARQIDGALAEADPEVRNQRVEFARQNTWTARVAEIDAALSARFPLVSILIITYNCREFIGPCLDTLLRNTSWPNYEVIVADNASSDNSANCAEERAARDPRIRVIRNRENIGFAAGNNVAARNAGGDYLVFLNPDTIVTPGWIGRLVRHAETQPRVGAVAAVTNFSGNETKVNFDYSDVAGMEDFAMKLAEERRGRSIEIDVAPLYCALVPGSAWTEAGELDTQFGAGMFEDDDFSLRLRQAGYRVLAAEDCFVHHFGNGSFSKLAVEESLRIFEENRLRFEEKWKQAWKSHTLRPGVRPPYDEPRFLPDEFTVVRSRVGRLEEG